MIKFKVLFNNNYIDLLLPDNFKLSMQYNSSIFNFDSILGSYSLPFDLYNNAHNNSLLQFPHSLANSNQQKRSIKSQLWVNGLLLHSGILEVEETSLTSFKCIFKFDSGSFASEFKDVLISDCELGGDQDWNWQNPFTNQNSDFALPFFVNNDFANESIFPFVPEDYANYFYINFYPNAEGIYDYYFKVIQELLGQMHAYSPVCPFPYVHKIIQYLFNSLGYNIQSNFFTSNDDLKNLIIYNINDVQQSTTYYEPPPADLQWILYILNTFNLNNCVPEISIHELILNLKNFFCIDFSFKDNDLKIRPIKDYINSTDYVDITSKVLKGEQKYFTESKKGFSINFQTDSNDTYLTTMIVDIKIYYTKMLQTITYPASLPEPGVIGDLILAKNGDLSNFYYNQYLEIVEGSPFNGFQQDWFALLNSYLSSYYSDYKTEVSFNSNISQYLALESKQQGNSVFHKTKTENKTLRLAFDVGKVNGIPRADNHTDNLYLDFWSEKGLFKTFWKEFTDWYMNIPFELDKKILFSVADLKNLDFSKKYLINNQLYFIDNIQVVINLNGTVEPATVRLLPV